MSNTGRSPRKKPDAKEYVPCESLFMKFRNRQTACAVTEGRPGADLWLGDSQVHVSRSPSSAFKVYVLSQQVCDTEKVSQNK